MKILSLALLTISLFAQTRNVLLVRGTSSGGTVTGSSSALTLNQYDVNYTLNAPGANGDWRFFGSSNYREHKSGGARISSVTNASVGSETIFPSKVYYSYWSDSAQSAPFYSVANGNSVVGLYTNSGSGRAQQTFTVVADGAPQVLNLAGIAVNSGSIALRVSIPGTTDYVDSSGITPGAEVYPSWAIAFHASAGTIVTVTATQVTAGTDAAGQPAMCLIGATLHDVSDTVNLQPVSTLSGITDRYAALPATTTLYDVSASNVITLHSSGTVIATRTFQQLIDAAVDGDEYRFADGWTAQNSTGAGDVPFYLRARGTSGWVKLVSQSIHTNLTAGQRTNPGDFPGGASSPPKITVNGQGPGIANDYSNASDSAHPAAGWYLEGFEVARGTASTNETYALVQFGVADPNDSRLASNSVPLSTLSHDIVFEHCYIHGVPGYQTNAGMTANGQRITLQDSYLSDIWSPATRETNAWNMVDGGYNNVINNFLSGAGETIMTGAAGPYTATVPHDITIKYNFFFKPRSWERSGAHPATVAKNLIECKNCDTLTLDSNVLENSIGLDQTSTGALITPRTVNGVGGVGPGGYGITSVSIQNHASHIRHNNNFFLHVNQGYSYTPLDDKITTANGFTSGQVSSLLPQMVPSTDNQITNTIILDIDYGKWGVGNAQGTTASGMQIGPAIYNAGTGSPPSSIALSGMGTNLVISGNTIMFDAVASRLDASAGALKRPRASGSGCSYDTDNPEGENISNNIFGGPLTGDCNYGVAMFPNGGQLWHDSTAVQTNNCVVNAPGYYSFGSVEPTTVYNASCPSGRGAPASTILNLEGAIRSGNRATIYPTPQ